MAPEHKADSSDGSTSKKRKAITMKVKLDIIKQSKNGETPTNIGQLLGLSRLTMATILKDKERIIEHVKGSDPMKAAVITKQRSGLIIEIEMIIGALVGRLKSMVYSSEPYGNSREGKDCLKH